MIPFSLHRDDERRHYFRLKDGLLLTYRHLAPDAVPALLDRLENPTDDRFTLIATLAGISQETRQLNRQLQLEAPLLSRYFNALERKLDILAQAILSETSANDQDTQEVCLSAGGLAFAVNEPLALETLLELRLVLLPAYVGIVAVGKVIRCQASDGPLPYSVGVEFIHMRESDRECIVKHVLEKQSQHIRQVRQRL